ncbi:helix-turn-helix domain-containing protein [Burkholderia sp.]|uniref:helix-turn-helix domain-containing protein n=1 Tax=Burkholderia sp. TaxID=36773 RepID=UPI00258C0509|nr:helix-turn-helix domain-containing protein [Burkholderia sp.]MCL4632285.1 helix-turn-helix domain-containing protein [Burkholderia sp.]
MASRVTRRLLSRRPGGRAVVVGAAVCRAILAFLRIAGHRSEPAIRYRSRLSFGVGGPSPTRLCADRPCPSVETDLAPPTRFVCRIGVFAVHDTGQDMILSRRPAGYLRPFIDSVWASYPPFSIRNVRCRERVLPTGAVHIAIRLDAEPLRLFDRVEDDTGRTVGVAVVGGARACAYLKDVSAPVPTVGALIRPGAVRLVTGVPASAFYGLHLSLDDLWGADAASIRDRLGEVASAAARLDLWETLLSARLPRVTGIDPAIAASIAQLNRGTAVRTIVQQLGCSHRHFIAQFCEAVGMPPKRYGRVRRFAQLLDGLSAAPPASWADAAAAAGYADQPHFNREFLEFAGLSPEQYRQRASANGFHVPL